MTTSSARPDYLYRYAMLVSDRSTATRSASTRAAVALSAYRSSCPDIPVSGDAPTLTDGALARSDGMVARVRRVASAFVIADRSDGPVVVVDDDQFGRFLPGLETAAVGDNDHRTELFYRRGWALTDRGTHTIGPADLKGSYEVFVGAEVTRTSYAEIDKNGLDAKVEVEAFAGARAAADGTFEAGAVSGRGHVQASVGAEASASAHARINLDEIHADISGGGFIGARGALDAEVEAMGVGWKGAVEGRAGIGADFSSEGHLGWDKVGFEFSGGFAMGLGGGGSGGVSVNPRKTVSEAVRIGTRLPGDAEKVAKTVQAKTEDVIDDGLGMAGDAYRGGREVFNDGLELARDPLGNVGSATLKPISIGDYLETVAQKER